MSRAFDLVIFDCDGVLVDSEVISTRTLIQTLAAHGLETDLAHVRKTYLGRAMHVVAERLRAADRPRIADGFEADFLARLFAAYRRELVGHGGRARAYRRPPHSLLHGDEQPA